MSKRNLVKQSPPSRRHFSYDFSLYWKHDQRKTEVVYAVRIINGSEIIKNTAEIGEQSHQSAVYSGMTKMKTCNCNPSVCVFPESFDYDFEEYKSRVQKHMGVFLNDFDRMMLSDYLLKAEKLLLKRYSEEVNLHGAPCPKDCALFLLEHFPKLPNRSRRPNESK